MTDLRHGGLATHGPSDEAPEVLDGPLDGVSERVRDLLASMTLREKLAQVVGLWVGAGADGEVVAPLQDAMLGEVAPPFEEFAVDGLGHLTRVFGTEPVSVPEGVRRLRELQERVVGSQRLGIPAIAHEECLTGLAAYGATAFPTPLAWAATFDEDVVKISDQLTSTRIACDPTVGEFEGAYLTMLADASIFTADGDTLTLSNDSDTVLATFTAG